MRVKRVEHVAIAVRNLSEVMQVFQDKLGLALEYEEDFPQYATRIAMYPVGETYLELLAATGASSDVATWLSVKPGRFVLPAGGRRSLTVTSRLPARIEPGDHDALVLLTTHPRRKAGVAVRLHWAGRRLRPEERTPYDG